MGRRIVTASVMVVCHAQLRGGFRRRAGVRHLHLADAAVLQPGDADADQRHRQLHARRLGRPVWRPQEGERRPASASSTPTAPSVSTSRSSRSSGPSVHVSAGVSPANGQGTWSDDRGNSGTFAFFGNTAGLPPRPLPTPIAVSGQVFVGHVAASVHAWILESRRRLRDVRLNRCRRRSQTWSWSTSPVERPRTALVTASRRPVACASTTTTLRTCTSTQLLPAVAPRGSTARG